MGSEQIETRVKRRPGFFRVVLYVLLGVILFAGGLVGAIFFYEEEIKAAIIKELNKNLRAEVKIDPKNIDVTILSTFPNCALRFRDVLMLEALKKKNRDTLLFAGKLDLHFDFMDMWKGRYEIHSLTLSNCLIKPMVDSKGQGNYEFWQEPDNAASEGSAFRLNDVRITKARVIYIDNRSGVSTDFLVNRLNLEGDFSSERYDINAKTGILLHAVKIKGASYAKQKKIDAQIGIIVSGEKYTLHKSTLKVNDLELALDGGFTLKNEGIESLDLRYKAPELDIESLLSLLPEAYRDKINGYESSGTLYAEGDVKWNHKRLHARGDFGAKDAVITYVPENTSARKINFKGSFLYGDEVYAEVRDLGMELEGGTINGSFRLGGKENPELTLEAQANTDLTSLVRFFPIDTLEKLSGHLRLDVRLRGPLAELEKREPNDKVMVKVQAQVKDLVTQFRHDDKTYTIANCLLRADDHEIEVRNLELKRGSSDVTINGKLPGFVKYIFGKPVPLRIEGTLRSEQLVVSDFVPVEKGGSSSTTAALIPDNLILNVSSSIGKLTFGKFEASGISGLIEIRDQKLFLSDVNLKTMQGSATIDALADNSKGRLNVWIESSLKRINVTELFRQMNDFGQTTLQEKHIKGFVTADLRFSGTWSSALESDLSSIKSTCELSIDKGELNGFSPLLSLAKFMDVKELERIRFGQLTSTVQITGEKITIPRTSIKNSAINLEFWGSHTFNHDIDYHFQMLTADLLKARKNRTVKEEEFGPVTRDAENTRSVFIAMTGNLDDPKIKYDKQGLQQKVRGDIKKERENLKQLIREEFGFNKDEPGKPETKQENAQPFKLEEAEKRPAKKELVLKKKEEEDF